MFKAGKGAKSSPRKKNDRIEDILDERRAGVKPGGQSKKKALFGDDAPGLHVLSADDRRKVMQKIRDSRQISDDRAREKEEVEKEKRRTAFANFAKSVKEREQE